MRIAIVGAGIAGLGAAWSLRGEHPVTLFEGEPLAGGHADTRFVEDDGRRVPVDTGFIIFNEWEYPNFTQLLAELGVTFEIHPLTVSVIRGADSWATVDRDTPLFRRIRGDADRFTRACPTLRRAAPQLSLREYLDAEGYSAEFRSAALSPVLSVLFVTRTGLLDLPAAVAARMFEHCLSFFVPTALRVVTGGTRTYVDALVSQLPVEPRTDEKVVRVFRKEAGVVIGLASGREERFDQVVLAVNARQALALLESPSEVEQEILGRARFERCRILLHRDSSLLPRDPAHWSSFNYLQTDRHAAPVEDGLAGTCTYYFPAASGSKGVGLVSIDPSPGDVAPALEVESFEREHLIYDCEWHAAVSRIGEIQGVGATWYCGGHATTFPSHEASLCSGLAIGRALTGRYAFRGNALARQVFEYWTRSFPRRPTDARERPA